MTRKIVLLLLVTNMFILWMNTPATAGTPHLELTSEDGDYRLLFNLQYRPRFEYNDNKDFKKDTSQSFVSHRARFTLTGAYQDFLEIVFDPSRFQNGAEPQNRR